jgi:hypothetical protein
MLKSVLKQRVNIHFCIRTNRRQLGRHAVPRARSGGRLDADPVVYGRPNTLFATEVTLGRLNGHVP